MESQNFFNVFYSKLSNNETYAYRRFFNPTKPILLMIHGQLTTSSWFYEIFNYLKDFLDLILIDLRGYGQSSYNIPIKSMIDFSNDILLFVEQLGIKRKFNLLGFSLGGAVALQFACKYSDMLENLILVSTTGICGFPIFDKNGERIKTYEDITNHWYYNKIIQYMKNKDNKHFEDTFFEELSFLDEKKEIKKMFIEEIMLQRNLFETVWASNSFNISSEHNLISQGTNEVKDITCRTILIHGTADKSISFKESEKVYRNISSKEKILEIIKGGDHYAIVNKPIIIANLIKKHLGICEKNYL